MPGKRLDVLRQCRKGKRTKRASRGKNCAQAPSLDLTLLIAVRREAREAKRHAALDSAHVARRSSAFPQPAAGDPKRRRCLCRRTSKPGGSSKRWMQTQCEARQRLGVRREAKRHAAMDTASY